jgi:hypothetical protein
MIENQFLHGQLELYLQEQGLKPTLRDQFAMAALQGMLANVHSRGTLVEFVTDAYVFADAMITERAK